MAKRDPRKIVLATYREPKPKAKRCGTCKGQLSTPMATWCVLADKPMIVNPIFGVCDAWTKRD